MKYVFIINPVSGNGRKAAALIRQVEALIADPAETRDIRYYTTDGESDATVLANRIAIEAEEQDEEVCIYACGGDGTINEVANGLWDCDNAYLGIVPVGSGNDFVRNFDNAEDFLDVEKQLDAKPRNVDLIRYYFASESGEVERYCVNGINIGFDGNTAILAHSLKEIPGINGSASYVLAVAINMIKKRGANLRVTVDGEVLHEGELLLCTAANGRFCGGGFESCPNAKLDNGLIEVLVITDIPRRKFFSLVPKYKAGKIQEVKGVHDIAKFAQGEHVVIEPLDGEMQFVADGEIMHTGRIEIEICKRARRILVP